MLSISVKWLQRKESELDPSNDASQWTSLRTGATMLRLLDERLRLKAAGQCKPSPLASLAWESPCPASGIAPILLFRLLEALLTILLAFPECFPEACLEDREWGFIAMSSCEPAPRGMLREKVQPLFSPSDVAVSRPPCSSTIPGIV